MMTCNNPTGRELRDLVLTDFEQKKKAFVLEARIAFIELLLCVHSAPVNDIFVEYGGSMVLPDDTHPRTVGAVPMVFAKRKIIEKAGYVPHARPSAHGCPQQHWKIKDRTKATLWLAENKPMLASEKRKITKSQAKLF